MEIEADKELFRTLGRLEGKVDSLTSQITSKNAEQDVRITEHGTRLNRMENRQNWFIGAGAAAGAAVAAAWQWISKGGG